MSAVVDTTGIVPQVELHDVLDFPELGTASGKRLTTVSSRLPTVERAGSHRTKERRHGTPTFHRRSCHRRGDCAGLSARYGSFSSSADAGDATGTSGYASADAEQVAQSEREILDQVP